MIGFAFEKATITKKYLKIIDKIKKTRTKNQRKFYECFESNIKTCSK